MDLEFGLANFESLNYQVFASLNCWLSAVKDRSVNRPKGRGDLQSAPFLVLHGQTLL